MIDPASSTDRRALLQQALQALDEMQDKLRRAEGAGREPVAIVGMSCRFPGGADTPEAYWAMLREGRDAVGSYPPERVALVTASGVDVAALGDPSRWHGGFLDDIDRFDPLFFGVAPREAATMDPQQRMLLEVGWSALEDAGIPPDSLAGSPTGVFVGITTNDYGQLAKLNGAGVLDVYTATGGALNAAAGRVAYTLGLQGPAMAIDTACSSSLVAVHQACQSLRAGESSLALAGGVNLLLLPEAFVCFEAWGMMAPDGRCKTFDAAADGFVRAEGCGVVVLKLLRDAVADGDRVLAVIRGSAVNQDGASSGLTVPNGPAQQAVLRRALANAGVEPADVQYFEAHGTGTTLGDPIEVEAIGTVLGRGRTSDQPLLLGSVKTNMGHLESAAGIAGLIKVVLSMQHGEIPPHLHFREPNPQIPWPSFPVVVPTVVTPWEGVGGRRVAGVSAFGFSGTNAHVVLESAPPVAGEPAAPRGAELVMVSGRTEAGRGAAAAGLASWLGAHPEVALADVAATANGGRAMLPHRAAVVAADPASMAEKLRAIASEEDVAGVTTGRAGRPTVGFVFSGQGSQWVGMGRGLYGVEPVFRGVVDRLAGVWESLGVGGVGGPGLLEVLWSGDRLGLTEFTQPALFVVGVGLVELWGSWGVVPSVVLGHSVGEFVAAAVAGVFSVEDGLGLVAARGRLMGGLAAGGVMVAVFASVGVVEEVLAGLSSGLRGRVGVAAVNGVAHTVVSGADDAVGVVVGVLEGRGVRVSRLVVSHAFHSPLMEPVVGAFGEVVAGVGLSAPSLRVVSNVSGAVVGAEMGGAAYWVEHVVAPVRFADGVGAMRGLGVDVFVEVGPHPVLGGMVAADGVGDGEVWVGSLRRGRDDREQVLGALGAVAVAGVDVRWDAVAAPGARRLPLPTTPFRRDRHWLAPVAPGRSRSRGGHPLLGPAVHVPALRATVHETVVRHDAPAWLADHRLSGTVVFPGSAYLEMFVAASDLDAELVDDVSMREALIVGDDDADVSLQLVVEDHPAWREAKIVSVHAAGRNAAPGWTTHATATLRRRGIAPSTPALDLEGLHAAFPDEVDVGAYYARLAAIGLTYGPTFQGLTRLRRRDHAAAGLAELPDEVADGERYTLHPALLDACFHVLGVAIAPLDESTGDDMYVPVAVDGLRVEKPAGARVWCVVTILDAVDGRPTVSARVALFGTDGSVVATIDRLEVRRTPRSVWQRAAAARHPMYELVWRPQTRPAGTEPPRACVVVGTPDVSAEVVAGLVARGCRAVPVGLDERELDTELAMAIDALAPIPADVVLMVPDEVEGLPGAGLRGALAVAQALGRGSTACRLWLVTRGAQSVDGEAPSPAHAAVWGFGRVLANEQPALGTRLVDLDPAEPVGELDELVAELAVTGPDEQVAVRGRRRAVARLVRLRVDERGEPSGPAALVLSERGSLEALGTAALTRRPPGPGEVEVEVRATGLNFRDVLNVLGMYPGDPGPPGLECAGVVVAVGDGVDDLAVGDRVMGIAPNAFDTHVVTSSQLLVEIPPTLTFAEAATIPIAFLTVAYGFDQLAGLRAGQRVLIHAAAGGVGQAAVQLAQRAGAEVYATVGSAPKRRHVEAMGVRHVYGSRTLDFAAGVLADTGGAGVDIVLNSLADEFVDRSFDALGHGGRFLELGKRGIWSAERAATARPDAVYRPYDLADLLAADPAEIKASLQTIADDLAAGRLRPLPLRAFPASRVEDAFRFMAQARHIGKVVVTHHPSGPLVREDGAYLITGGLGGLGLAVAGWYASHAAGAVVLAGRGEPTPEAAAVIAELQERTDVRVVGADVASAEGVERMLGEVAATGLPLRGYVHAAGVVDDGAIALQSAARFAKVLAPKVLGAELLDVATRGLDLDHAVSFSSASALLGAPGQSGYAAANAALDAMAHRRRAEGRPATSIDWGAWAEVGMAARLGEREQEHLAAQGIGALAPATALEALGELLGTDIAQTAVLAVDWATLLGGGAPPLLAELADGAAATDDSAPVGVPDIRADLEAAPPEERRAVLDAFVHQQITRVLGLDPREPLDPWQGLTDIGMDSLMAVELSNRLRAGLALTLPSTLAFEHPTFRALTEYLAAELSGDGGPLPPPVRDHDDHREAELEALAHLSDEEVADRLLRELEEGGY